MWNRKYKNLFKTRRGRDTSGANVLKKGDLEIISLVECKKAYKGTFEVIHFKITISFESKPSIQKLETLI